jgi:TP901 family phage tail tape measure protein
VTDRSYRVRLEANVAGFIAQVGVAAVGAVNKLGSAADAVNAKVGKIGDSARLIPSKIGTASTAAVGHLDRMAAAANKNHVALNTIGSGALKMGVAAGAGLGLAAKAAIDWESAWTGVTKTVNGSTAQMAELEGQLRGMAKTLPETHDQIAAVAEAAGQLGVRREDIASFTKVMVDLGETTNLTSDEAATSLAQFMNVMGTAPGNVGRLGAAIVALGNNGASTEKDIVEMAQRISGSGKIIGLSEQQVLGYASALANVGIDAEAGGTAISQIFTRIDKAVSEGGDGLANFAKVSGVTADQFKQRFQTDAAGATEAFIEGLGQINRSGGDVNATLAALGITEIRQRDAVLRLAASGTNLSDSLKTSADGWRDNTALVNEAAKRYSTTESQIKISWNNIKDSAITAGAAMLPTIRGIAEGVAHVAEFFGKLPAPVRNASVALLAVVAAGGLVVGGVLKMVTALGAAKGAMTALGISTTRTNAALSVMGKGGLALGAAAGLLFLSDAIEKAAGATHTMNLAGLSGDLLRFGETGKATGEIAKNFGDDLGGVSRSIGADGASIGAALKEATTGNDNFIEKLRHGTPGFGEYVDRIHEIDQGLAQLVQGGNADSAAKAFGRLQDIATSMGINQDQLNKAFPEYGRALGAVAVDAEVAGTKSKGAADGTSALAQGLDATGNSAESAADKLKAYIDALFLVPNLVLGVRDAQRGVQAAIDDATASLKENGRTLDQHTEKGRNNQAAIDAIATASQKQSEAYLNANASQKVITAGALEARAAYIQLAIKMGLPKAAAIALANEVIKIPTKVDTQVTNNAAAKPKTDVNAYASALGLVPRTVPTVLVNNGAGTPKTNAERYRELLGLVPRTVPTVVTNTAPVAQTKINQYRTALGLIPPGKSTQVSTPGAVTSQGQVGGLLGLLGALPASKSVTINTYRNMIETTTHRDVGVRVPQADGGFWPRGIIPSYADGKLPGQAMVAPGKGRGMVQWAEAETGGEAFIPLAPAKRARSMEILSQVAGAFGLQLVRSFADGGFLPGGRLVDLMFLLRQLGIPFNPSAGVNYGSTLVAQNKANSQVRPAKAAANTAAVAEAAAKADVTRLQRAITLQQRYVTSLRQNGASDSKIKAEQKETIALQDQLYRAKLKLKSATDASNKADDNYKTKADAATKATEAHKAAIEKLIQQQQAAVEMAAQIADGLTSSANIGDLFQNSLTGKGLLADLQAQGAEVGKFRGQVDQLRKMGLSEDLIQQLIGKGAEQGGEVAQAILDGGIGLVAALNKAQKALDDQANLIGAGSANKKYGQTIAGARAGGGGVQEGLTYWVGEKGRELFTAPADGYIHANSAVDPNRYVHSGGGWGGGGTSAVREDHYHQTVVNNGVSMAEADLIAQRAAGRMRMMGRR